MEFLYKQAFYLFIIPLLLVPLVIRKIFRDRAGYRVFTEGRKEIFSFYFSSAGSLASIVALILMILALARPVWNPQSREVESRGQDFVFILDTSKSMLAEDTIPNRFNRSKEEILKVLESADGNRYGLVAFAGTPVMRSPLTRDYAFIEKSINLLDVQYTLSTGGSEIGQALDFTIRNSLDESSSASKAMILITDGEDQGDFPEEVLRVIRQEKIRLVIIGVGAAERSSSIPDPANPGESIRYQGEEVKTRLNRDYLQKMADRGGPLVSYWEVGTSPFDLTQLIRELESEGHYGESVSQTSVIYTEGFVYFLAAGLLFFLFYLVQPVLTSLFRRTGRE